jgi:hypothetical protein
VPEERLEIVPGVEQPGVLGAEGGPNT